MQVYRLISKLHNCPKNTCFITNIVPNLRIINIKGLKSKSQENYANEI